MNNIRKTMIKRARRVFRLRKINKGRDVKMSNIKNELRKAKGKAFKRQMNDACFYVRELFARVVKTFFSHGKVVSDAHNQQANNTSSSLLIMGEKKNKGRREIKMNNLTEKARRINEVGSKKNKTKRGAKMMNNMTERCMKRIRRVIGVGRSLVFSLIKAGRKLAAQAVGKFGKRQTGFPVPQTGSESRAVKHAERRSVSQTGYKNKLTDLPRLLAFVFKKVLNDLAGLRLSNRLGMRRFGKRETGFPVPQTDCKLSVGNEKGFLRGISGSGDQSGRSVFANGKSVDEDIDRKFTDDNVNRRFGERETGEQFPVPQTGRKVGAVQAAKSRSGDEKAFLRRISNGLGMVVKSLHGAVGSMRWMALRSSAWAVVIGGFHEAIKLMRRVISSGVGMVVRYLPKAVKSTKSFVRDSRNGIVKPIHRAVAAMRRVALRAAVVVVMASMLATSNPTAAQSVALVAGELYQDARYSYYANQGLVAELGETMLKYGVLSNSVLRLFLSSTASSLAGGGSKKQAISRIEISPDGKVAIWEGDRVNFVAVGYDAQDNIVQGAKFSWSAVEDVPGATSFSFKNGLFETELHGFFLVTASVNGISQTVKIRVAKNPKYRALVELDKKDRGEKVDETKLEDDVRQEMRRTRGKTVENSSRMTDLEKARLEKWDAEEQRKRKIDEEQENEEQEKRSRQGVAQRSSQGVEQIEGKPEVKKGKFVKVSYGSRTGKGERLERKKSEVRGKENNRARRFADPCWMDPAHPGCDDYVPPGSAPPAVPRPTPTPRPSVPVSRQSKLTGVNMSHQAYGTVYSYSRVVTKSSRRRTSPARRRSGRQPIRRPRVNRKNTVQKVVRYARVDIYIDGAKGAGGMFAGSSVCRSRLCSWAIGIPTRYHDGKQHTVYAYRSNQDGTRTQMLAGSPQTFTIGTPVSTPKWNNQNFNTANKPGVQPGRPPKQGTVGSGSGNFMFSAPVMSLAGRAGLDVSLSLNYNSLLWHTDGKGNITYDIDKGSPAPGWSIGFGKLMDMGSIGGVMLESADGTRHPYAGEIVAGASPGYSTYYGRTTDGTFIDYRVKRGPGGMMSGWLFYPDGGHAELGAVNDGVIYPTRMVDEHGNYFNISYVNNKGPRISSIADTLGRHIVFKYDVNNRLIAIKGPGYNNTTQTYVRLHYKQQTLSYGFAGLKALVRNSSPHQIEAIYYPVTRTGYWFGDADSYSSYGMLKKVKVMRNMTSTGTDVVQGTATAGTMTSEAVYNYPLTADASLTTAPMYTSKTEKWQDMDTVSAVVTRYAVNNATNPRTTTITLPDGTKRKSSSYKTTDWRNGLLYQTELVSARGKVLSKQEMTWAQGYNDTTRVTQVLSTDEKGQTKKSTFGYGAKYNQVTSVKEYGYTNNLLRETVTTYENSNNYLGLFAASKRFIWGKHLFNLPLTVEVKDGSGVRQSRVEYTYDATALKSYASGPWYYHQHFNPASSTYHQVSQYRGNVVKVKTYADAVNLTGAIEHNYTYDMTGNQLTATTDCCQQVKAEYTLATQYAYPASVRRGAATGTEAITTRATYDFNTGLVKTATDANGRTTSYSYDAIGKGDAGCFADGREDGV